MSLWIRAWSCFAGSTQWTNCLGTTSTTNLWYRCSQIRRCSSRFLIQKSLESESTTIIKMQLCRSRESTWSLWRRSCKTHVFPSRFPVFLVKDLLLFFHFDSFNLGGQQPGWERGERYFVLCWCKFKELLLSLRPFSGLIFIKENFINLSFQTDRVCWFAGWPCRMFCSNLCL